MNAGSGARTGHWIILLAFGAIAVLPAVAQAADAEVTIRDTKFNPQGVTIDVGDEVVWKDEQGGHDVTFDDGSFKEPKNCRGGIVAVGCTQPGDRIERTFETAGAFKYHCSVHGAGMSGLVNVRGAAEVTTTTAPATTTEPPTTATAPTTTTTRQLATSSTQAPTTTTTTLPEQSTTTMAPNEAPAFDPGDDGDGQDGTATPAGSSGDSGSGTGTVALIVAALLGVAGGGGVLLWRLRPRST